MPKAFRPDQTITVYIRALDASAWNRTFKPEPVQVQAEGYGAWAVHGYINPGYSKPPAKPRYYTVTHIATGRRLPETCITLTKARALALSLQEAEMPDFKVLRSGAFKKAAPIIRSVLDQHGLMEATT